MRRPGGGVAVVIRNHIPFKVLEGVSGPDLIALELDELYLIGAYILPDSNHDWTQWCDVHTQDRFSEALAFCAVDRSKPTGALGDINCRTHNDTTASSTLPRSSCDLVQKTNTRGKWFLKTCEDSRMEILNGTQVEKDSPGAFTSFQSKKKKKKKDDDNPPSSDSDDDGDDAAEGDDAEVDSENLKDKDEGGKAVVDYALFSRDFVDRLQSKSFQVIRTDGWSDHAILALHLKFPAKQPHPALTPLPLPIPTTSVPSAPPPPTPCDILTAETIAAGQSDEEATRALYGSVAGISDRRVTVHLVSTCRKQGQVDARAAFGVYWGEGSRHNAGWRIPGKQVEGRALLTGILHALTASNSDRALEVFTTSKLSIRTICYATGRNYTRGWDCANGDLLQLIARAIRARTAQLTFFHIPNTETPSVATAGARKLALAATYAAGEVIIPMDVLLRSTPLWNALPTRYDRAHPLFPSQLKWPTASTPNTGLNWPKVTTTLAASDPPKPKIVVNVSAAQLAIGDRPDAHRNRLTCVSENVPPDEPNLIFVFGRVRKLQSDNLNKLVNAETLREWWQIMRKYIDPKRRDARVTAEQLRGVFEKRLNPPTMMPGHFDADVKRLRNLMSDAIPPYTTDNTPQQFFSRPFELSDIERMKLKIRNRSTKSAHGIDHCSYKKIQSIPNDALLKLFNYCVENRTGAQDWFTTLLIGILKMGKSGDDPDSYRLIGLECCLLKCLTLLIDMRVRAWAEAYNILPDSQNGFREKYRTHNNSFILRCAIDRARAEGKPLYVAFVDLTNAFPSTDLPTLWMKLYAAGVSGPLFDWLRMLYARMSYVVRQGSELTAAFKSLIGVLTGDTASPILWNVYFADLADVFEPDTDDICLNGRPVSHLEQADDVALFSTTAAGLQRKLDRFFQWCRINFMVISVLKTEWMLFGPLPRVLPIMVIGDAVIRLVKQYKFVGLIFSSIDYDIFAAHYTKKASKARAVGNTTFSAKAMIGCLPPYEGIRLYMARMDPHLTFGCEVCLDVVPKHLAELADVQHQFLRRLLGLHRRSILSVLFTETGIIPLSYRRPIIALGYLMYLISLPPNHFACAAFRDSILLARQGHPCWFSDLRNVMHALPVPVELSLADLSVDGVISVRKKLDDACRKWLTDTITGMASRIPLIQGRLERNEDGHFVPTAAKLRQYLRVPVPAHRKALTRLLLSAHTLGIELLRYDERGRKRAPRAFRFCRFCRRGVESEGHALIVCTAPGLCALRRTFYEDVFKLLPELPRKWNCADDLLRALLQSRNFDVVQRLARYTFDVLAEYSTCAIFKPAEYLYTALE